MDAYTLLQDGSTVTGDTWTMLSNLQTGGGDGIGIGQVVANLAGTVLTIENFRGSVGFDKLKGTVSRADMTAIAEQQEILGILEEEE